MKPQSDLLKKIIIGTMEENSISMEEFGHLSKFDTLHDSELMDYLYLSKMSVEILLKEFISKGIKVICNLTDRDGKIVLNMLSKEEKEVIKKKQIICFKFPPIISINITNKFQNYYKN
jgi:Icc-related predicted phosphoesterase